MCGMKKLMSLMIGMALALGAVGASFAQEKKEEPKKTEKKAPKKGKTKDSKDKSEHK
jgi:hypothetical protein